MYLKRLEILGFKSFADKIRLDFLQGVTAVVGPNGSGKSNISDALRWVLGEQSIKNLRGSKMDDVIFAGTEYRKALGLAEVTIVLDNSDHAVPLDFNEISVTRKLFRSGESEFLINKSQVRLKDIHELFFDTGLGKDAYSVISQGKIDSILSVKAEERRSIFEEAAGINKYKTRKHIAEKKLEDSDRNLIRIQDIISELHTQLGPLETQSLLAEEFISLKKSLTHLEVNHYGGLVQKLQTELADLTVAKNDLETKFQDFEGQESIIDSEIEEKRLNLLDQESLLNQLNEDFFRIQNQIDKYKEQIHFFHTRIEDLEKQEKEYEKNAENSLKKKESVLLEHVQLKEEIALIIDKLSTEKLNLETEESNLTKLNQQIKNDEEEEQNLKTELIEILNDISALKNKLNSTTLQKEFLNKQITDFQKKLQQLAGQASEWENEIQLKNKNLTEVEQQISELHQAQTVSSNQLEQLESDIKTGEAKNQEWRQRIRGLEGKISVFEEMEKSFQGYFQGVKSLLADAGTQPFHRKIRGIVADLIKVKPGMELAIETALGSSLQNIVIEDDQAAQEAVAYLKKSSRGRATFLPLNLVRGQEPRIHQYQDLFKQYACHPATGLLEYDRDYAQVVNYLLSQVIVAPDLNAAVHISKKMDRGFRIVTPEGDVVNPGGAITGGSTDKQRLGLLSRKREIEDLRKEKSDTEAFLDKGLRNVKEKTGEFQTDTVKLLELKKSENDAQLQKITLEREIKTINENVHHNQEECQILKVQLADFDEENIAFDTGKDEIILDIGAKELSLQEIETKVGQLTVKLTEYKTFKDNQLLKISDLKSVLSAAQQELNGKQLLETNLLRQINEADGFNEELTLKKNELKSEQEKIVLALGDLETKINEENLRLTAQQDRMNIAKTEKEEILAKIRDLENRQRSYRRKHNDFQNQLHRLDLAMSQKNNEIDNLERNLNDDYGADWQTEIDVTWIEPEDVDGKINHFKNQIRELGSVNLAAIDDYRQIKQRYEFLSEQAEDLLKAKASLQKVIAEIEKTITKRFTETFELITTEFKRIFSELFEGGHADLFLIEPDNVLGSGIEIIAQPPGKKLQSLSLLSGGERAMTAIALLFAILSIKPAPFCILDEIDATLDEVNVRRFSKLLEIFSKELQFIVVTHRRGTMEVANALYGVTMEEMGISKLISLDLSEKAG